MPKGIRTVDYFGAVERFLPVINQFTKDDIVEMMVHPRINAKGENVDYKSFDGRLMRDVYQDIAKIHGHFCTYKEVL